MRGSLTPERGACGSGGPRGRARGRGAPHVRNRPGARGRGSPRGRGPPGMRGRGPPPRMESAGTPGKQEKPSQTPPKRVPPRPVPPKPGASPFARPRPRKPASPGASSPASGPPKPRASPAARGGPGPPRAVFPAAGPGAPPRRTEVPKLADTAHTSRTPPIRPPPRPETAQTSRTPPIRPPPRPELALSQQGGKSASHVKLLPPTPVATSISMVNGTLVRDPSTGETATPTLRLAVLSQSSGITITVHGMDCAPKDGSYYCRVVLGTCSLRSPLQQRSEMGTKVQSKDKNVVSIRFGQKLHFPSTSSQPTCVHVSVWQYLKVEPSAFVGQISPSLDALDDEVIMQLSCPLQQQECDQELWNRLNLKLGGQFYEVMPAKPIVPVPLPVEPTKRDRIAYEVYTSEVSHVNGLKRMVEEYFAMFHTAPALPMDLPTFLSERELRDIFPNIELVLKWNLELLSVLETRIQEWGPTQCLMDAIAAQISTGTTPYEVYCANVDNARKTIERLQKKNKHFESTLQQLFELTGKDLMSLVITPVQRFPRYELLARDLLKCTEESHPDYTNIEEALVMAKAGADSINATIADAEFVAQMEDAGLQNYAAPKRRVVYEGVLAAVRPSRSQICVLCNDVLLVGTRDASLPSGRSFCGVLTMNFSCMWMLDLGSLDPQSNGESFEVYTPECSALLYAPSVALKLEWMSRIETLILSCVKQQDGDDRCRNSISAGIAPRRDVEYRYFNGALYTGGMRLGQRHGTGTMTFTNGDKYEGGWLYGDRSGQGTWTCAADPSACYTGLWKDDVKFVSVAEPSPQTVPLRKRRQRTTVVALYDYDGEGDELSFKEGDVIFVLDTLGGDPDWNIGEMDGERGAFPLTYVESLAE